MPVLYALLCCLFTAVPARAAVYCLAPGGDDAGPGSATAPFGSLSEALSHLAAGDTLLIRAGVYHGTAQVAASGSAGAPISLRAWPGECPVLDGAQPVAGPWSLDNGAVYKAAWPSQPSQVFCDGQLLNEARWPAAAVLGLSQAPVAVADWGCSTAVACASLPPVDLTGALIQIMPGQSWCGYTRLISSMDPSSGTLVFGSPGAGIHASVDETPPLPALTPRRGDRFYVFGKRALLTAAGQWYWDPAAQALYVWAPDGFSPTGRVEAGTAPWVLSLDNQAYVNISGLSVLGGGVSLHGSNHCTLQDLHLVAPNWTRLMNGYATQPQKLGGVEISGSGNQWLGGSVQYAGRSGVNVSGGSGHRVQGVAVLDCGWNWGNDGAIEIDKADQCVLQNNTVQRAARAGIIDGYSTRLKILGNLLQDVSLYGDDIGAFDAWQTDGQGTEIAGNLCRGNHSMWGAGIYLDDGSKNFYVHDNVVQGSTWFGITFKAVNDIENNTVLDAGHQAINCVPSQGLAPGAWDLSGAVVAHNQLVEAEPVQMNLVSGSIQDYGFYGGYAYLSPGAQRVELDWPQLVQPWWAVQVPRDLGAITTIQFGVVNTSNFDFSVGNLRYLPSGGSGDAGAVPVGGSWYVAASPAANASLTLTGPPAWGASGTQITGGWNVLGIALAVTVAGGSQDLSGYRGIAFDLSGTARHSYALVGCTDLDNGPEALPGRGATLPAVVGADLGTALGCQGGPAPSPTPGSAPPSAGPPDLGAARAVPNPSGSTGGHVALLLQAPADRLRFSLYSEAYTLARRWDLATPLSPGWQQVPLEPGPGLARGLYWLRAQAFRGGQTGKAATLAWYVAR